MTNKRIQKKAENRWLKKAGFGKEMADMGALAVELGRARGEVAAEPTPRNAAPRARKSASERTLTDMCREAENARRNCTLAVDLCSHSVKEARKVCDRAVLWCILCAAGSVVLNVLLFLLHVCQGV